MKFIGMDAHSRQCTFAVLGKNGKTLKRARIATQEDELLRFVRSIKGPKKMVFEEGIMSQWLFLLFKDEVDELVVCRPQEKEGAKNDDIDAEEIADLLRVNRLKTVFHEDSRLMNLRVLISGYSDVRQELVSAKNRYKALYREVAIPTDRPRFYESKEMLASLDTEFRYYVACTLFEQIKLLEEQHAGYLERFESNVRKYKPIRLLTSIPGIGPVRANQIVGVMVTPYRFATKYKLFSYAMLSGHKKESDGKVYKKKRAVGQSTLKEAFKSAALSAIQSDNNSLRRKYEDMRLAGADDRKARNAIAKKIAGMTLGIWKSGKKYNDKHMEVTRRRNQGCHSGT